MQLEAELETERMRVIACGVVALANTPESAAKARDMLPEYRSAPCDNVVQAVDREMALRGRVEQLEFKLDQEQRKSGQEMIERLSLVEKIQALEVEYSTLCGHIEQLREAVKEGLRTYKVPMTARICEAIAASTDGLKGY